MGGLSGLQEIIFIKGGLAQLARALAWHARGRRFDPDTLHYIISALYINISTFL